MQLQRTPSLFAALAQAIIYQQLSGKAASTILGRVRALFPFSPAGLSAEHILRCSDERLRSAGLSGPKQLALRDLARHAACAALPSLSEARALSDDILIERLTAVRGIGRWTVEMLLMFRLGRPDVLPLDDLGIRKGFARAFGLDELPTAAAMQARGARWKPYRSVASWYLWRVLDIKSF